VLEDIAYLKTFDVIHASPPCQGYSEISSGWDGYMKLIAPVRELLKASGVPYVIENVEAAPLYPTLFLCGSMFDGLGVQRHRIFESNMPLASAGKCNHNKGVPRYSVWNHGATHLTRWCPVYGSGGGKCVKQWASAMGINWMSRPELAEAIPPLYTKHIGYQIKKALVV
jgi:DNA (cytosine-5)-methyltransferase 1